MYHSKHIGNEVITFSTCHKTIKELSLNLERYKKIDGNDYENFEVYKGSKYIGYYLLKNGMLKKQKERDLVDILISDICG